MEIIPCERNQLLQLSTWQYEFWDDTHHTRIISNANRFNYRTYLERLRLRNIVEVLAALFVGDKEMFDVHLPEFDQCTGQLQ